MDRAGHEGRLLAGAVIDASGTWTSPNPAGASGLPALGERAASRRIRYGMPDVLGAERARYAGRRVLVLGGGHSATGTLLDLAELAAQEPGTRDHLGAPRPGPGARVRRRRGGPASPARRLGRRDCGSSSSEVRSGSWHPSRRTRSAARRMVRSSSPERARVERLAIEADELVVATGLRPDLSFLAELRLDLDPALECPRALAPLIDPNEHSCGTVRPHGAAELAQPEPGLFLVGMKSYGRAPTFLLATGHEQVRSVAAHLAGDEEAARRVELELPETGVCSGPRPPPSRAAARACRSALALPSRRRAAAAAPPRPGPMPAARTTPWRRPTAAKDAAARHPPASP